MTDEKRVEQLKNSRPIKLIDGIVIVLLVVIALILALTGVLKGDKGATLVVTANGQTSYYDLDEDRTITVNDVKIVIKDGKASVTSSVCPDQICVAHGKISHDNESIVCLPQGVVISVSSGDGMDASTGQGK